MLDKRVVKDIDTIIELLDKRFALEPKKSLNWLFEKNKDLQGESPMKFINVGKAQVVIDYLNKNKELY